MKEYELKYGCNPNQKPARVFMAGGGELPLEILSGKAGYINLLDALNSWQLVREIKDALGMCAATSFKHVSPTSAAVGLPMSAEMKKAFFIDDIEGLDDSPIATAYARARGTDRMSSFGDWIALSDKCDATCARIIAREVSDGIIAPAYDEEALRILKGKRKGNYTIIRIDEGYKPELTEQKQVFGVTFEQRRNDFRIDKSLLENIVTANKELPEEARRDLVIALITLKYTQLKEVEAGVAVSYGGTFVTTRDSTRIATIPVGYADGYPRSLSNKGYLLINGKKAPIIGRVCMDQFMVDVSDIPEAVRGTEVTLLGTDHGSTITAEELGDLSGRFSYELICCITKRVPRIYL